MRKNEGIRTLLECNGSVGMQDENMRRSDCPFEQRAGEMRPKSIKSTFDPKDETQLEEPGVTTSFEFVLKVFCLCCAIALCRLPLCDADQVLGCPEVYDKRLEMVAMVHESMRREN
ncbi:hypothetical protein PM082_011827 [Marasmius tenuissimus]|nr:hypothetical protein PM082_011827 [Marasmius tenuissimus]